MAKRGWITACIVVLLATWTQAQESRVEVIKDPRITALQQFRAEHAINPSTNTTISLGSKPIDKSTAKRVRMRGFRVQIFSGANRNDAVAVQNRFLKQFSDMGAYLNYEEPNFRVKVGDFRTRGEANNFMRRIRGQYSNVFVFVEDIWVWQ